MRQIVLFLVVIISTFVYYSECSESQPCKGKNVVIKDVFYLIPKTQKSCLTANRKGAFRMGSDKVELLRPYKKSDGSTEFSKVLKFPGCFEMSAELEVVQKLKEKSIIMYNSFKWLQAFSEKDVSKLDIGCTGQEPNGCGGEGNQCFFCDVCETLQKENNELDQKFEAECPKTVGKVYDYYDERCVRDWGKLDKDCDGTPDFMKEDKYKDYAQFLEDMKIEGYGTMKLQILLATNATEKQEQEMIKQKKKLRASGGDFNQQWNAVHKKFWLPKMIRENLIGCVEVYFDMCNKEPVNDAVRVDALNCPA